jgi:hypothetical protein
MIFSWRNVFTILTKTVPDKFKGNAKVSHQFKVCCQQLQLKTILVDNANSDKKRVIDKYRPRICKL